MLTVRLLAIVLLAAGALGAPGFAGSAAAGAVPPAAACEAVPELGLSDMVGLIDALGEQFNDDGYLATSVYGPALSWGDRASSAERAQIASLLEAFVACINEREPLRLIALLSERYRASLILDLVSGGDAVAVIADHFPVLVESGDPLQTPDIVRVWRPDAQPDELWAVVMSPVPGDGTADALFFVFTPVDAGWAIDLIATYAV